MRLLLVFLTLTLLYAKVISKLSCSSISQCDCEEKKKLNLEGGRLAFLRFSTIQSSGGVELLCPRMSSPNSRILMNDEPESIVFYCHSLSDFEDYKEVFIPPMIDPKKLVISQCYHSKNILRILSALNLKNITLFQLEENDFPVLSKKTLQGLESVNDLRLDTDNITSIDLDAFDNFINLTSLTINFNEIATNLSLGLFKSHLKTLQVLELQQDEIFYIPENFFENLTGLIYLDLGGNRISTIRRQTFRGLSNLTRLDLTENEINFIPEDVFADLRKLQYLFLSGNNITNVAGKLFEFNINLLDLKLAGCGMTSFSKGVYERLRQLEALDLSYNKFDTIPEFSNMGNLKIIKLNNNKIAKINMRTLSRRIEEIHLRNNLIDEISLSSIPSNIKILDLGGNLIKILDVTQVIVPRHDLLTLILENNKIVKVDFWEEIAEDSGTISPKIIIDLGDNPIDCNCHAYDFFKYIKKGNGQISFNNLGEIRCKSPRKLKNRLLKNIDPVKFQCPLWEAFEDNRIFYNVKNFKNCSSVCECNFSPANITLFIDCSHKKLTKIPDFEIPSVIKNVALILYNNSLGSVDVSLPLPCYKLDLGRNKIKEILRIPKEIRKLYIDNNQLEHLSNDVLETIKQSKSLDLFSLKKNPWVCDCSESSTALSDFIRHREKILVDPNEITCNNKSMKVAESVMLCHTTHIESPIAFGIITPLIILGAILFIYYKYQLNIKVWLYSNNLCLRWVAEREDEEKKFDAFISYSNKDEEYVAEELIPFLEGCPIPYNICLHFRDWIPGELIKDQIVRSVAESKRTIVILSKSFLESIWAKEEFREAHRKAMEDDTARVIIILYGDVDLNSVDDTLKSYLTTKTYLNWEDPYFWKKLVYALPHKKWNNLR